MKTELRKRFSELRDGLDHDSRHHSNGIITEKIKLLEKFRSSNVVLAYMAFGSEFSTDGVVRQVLEDGKILVLPKINRQERKLDLYQVVSIQKDLKPGVWGIPEPDAGTCAPISMKQIDFVLVPGLGFDWARHRLGYGAGFYDRLLADSTHVFIAAAAYSIQVIESIPVEPHDIPVDIIVTENDIYL